MTQTCRCGHGKVSAYDGKCGHCRTNRERKTHAYLLTKGPPKMQFTWNRTGGYECSTQGDARFSAFCAIMLDKRSLECWYQCDVKGYQPGGTDWKRGKGKVSLIQYPDGHQWMMYLSLWRFWAIRNMELMEELHTIASDPKHNGVLSDRFATTPINQAHALSTILNEWG